MEDLRSSKSHARCQSRRGMTNSQSRTSSCSGQTYDSDSSMENNVSPSVIDLNSRLECISRVSMIDPLENETNEIIGTNQVINQYSTLIKESPDGKKGSSKCAEKSSKIVKNAYEGKDVSICGKGEKVQNRDGKPIQKCISSYFFIPLTNEKSNDEIKEIFVCSKSKSSLSRSDQIIESSNQSYFLKPSEKEWRKSKLQSENHVKIDKKEEIFDMKSVQNKVESYVNKKRLFNPNMNLRSPSGKDKLFDELSKKALKSFIESGNDKLIRKDSQSINQNKGAINNESKLIELIPKNEPVNSGQQPDDSDKTFHLDESVQKIDQGVKNENINDKYRQHYQLDPKELENKLKQLMQNNHRKESKVIESDNRRGENKSILEKYENRRSINHPIEKNIIIDEKLLNTLGINNVMHEHNNIIVVKKDRSEEFKIPNKHLFTMGSRKNEYFATPKPHVANINPLKNESSIESSESTVIKSNENKDQGKSYHCTPYGDSRSSEELRKFINTKENYEKVWCNKVKFNCEDSSEHKEKSRSSSLKCHQRKHELKNVMGLLKSVQSENAFKENIKCFQYKTIFTQPTKNRLFGVTQNDLIEQTQNTTIEGENEYIIENKAQESNHANKTPELCEEIKNEENINFGEKSKFIKKEEFSKSSKENSYSPNEQITGMPIRGDKNEINIKKEFEDLKKSVKLKLEKDLMKLKREKSSTVKRYIKEGESNMSLDQLTANVFNLNRYCEENNMKDQILNSLPTKTLELSISFDELLKDTMSKSIFETEDFPNSLENMSEINLLENVPNLNQVKKESYLQKYDKQKFKILRETNPLFKKQQENFNEIIDMMDDDTDTCEFKWFIFKIAAYSEKQNCIVPFPKSCHDLDTILLCIELVSNLRNITVQDCLSIDCLSIELIHWVLKLNPSLKYKKVDPASISSRDIGPLHLSLEPEKMFEVCGASMKRAARRTFFNAVNLEMIYSILNDDLSHLMDVYKESRKEIHLFHKITDCVDHTLNLSEDLFYLSVENEFNKYETHAILIIQIPSDEELDVVNEKGDKMHHVIHDSRKVIVRYVCIFKKGSFRTIYNKYDIAFAPDQKEGERPPDDSSKNSKEFSHLSKINISKSIEKNLDRLKDVKKSLRCEIIIPCFLVIFFLCILVYEVFKKEINIDSRSKNEKTFMTSLFS